MGGLKTRPGAYITNHSSWTQQVRLKHTHTPPRLKIGTRNSIQSRAALELEDPMQLGL